MAIDQLRESEAHENLESEIVDPAAKKCNKETKSASSYE